MIGDIEAAFVATLTDAVVVDGSPLPVVATSDPDGPCLRAYRSDGAPDYTGLDHPVMVVDVFGDAQGVVSKAVVATATRDALARVFALKGKTVGDVVVTDVAGRLGPLVVPEPSGRWHYQFTVAVTCHEKNGV